MTEVRADDGFALPVVRVEGSTRGAIIVVHEIFGLTPHIRAVADRFAALGYTVAAPDFFARRAPQRVLPYSAAGKSEGLAIKNAIGEARMASDAIAVARSLPGPVGIVGFCLGGTVAWLAAASDAIAAAVGYYAVRIDDHLASIPRAPVLLHFGDRDPSIPLATVDAVASAGFANVTIHRYDAGHAFNRDDDTSYAPASAALAWDRTMAFFASTLR